MKKMLLFVAALFSVATVCAQSDFEFEEPTWTKNLTDVVEKASDANVNAPVVITNQGDVVKTGTFTQAFEFAGKELEPIAKSAYIVKYDKKGNEVWGNALQGAATVTAITADEAGNIYIAGRFADKVIITSTDGSTAEIDGMAENTEQVSGFIAAFDQDGKLFAHRQIVPSLDQDLLETWSYFPEKGDVYFRINSIKVANEKVYVTSNYTGVNDIDDVKLVGRTLAADLDGWIMYVDINSSAALSFNKDLTEAGLVANVQTTESAVYKQMGLHDVNLAVDGEDVFVAWTGLGDLTMTTEKESRNFSFNYTDAGQEHPFVVANVTTGEVKEFRAPVVESLSNFYTVSSMQIMDQMLCISGTYVGALPFDNSLSSSGSCDAFVAALAADDLSVVLAKNSGIAENNNENEIAFGSDIFSLSSIVNVIDKTTKAISQSYIFGYDFEGEQGLTLEAPYVITAFSSSIAGQAVNSNDGTSSTLRYFADEDFTQGIETIDNSQSSISNDVIYNLQGQRVNKAQKGVFIQNGKKVVVK
ncbi:MAG: hypothetical protein IKH48_06500 [Prevotella sp.]|nr:hypothetical protein [Prevotella sp.]